MKYIRAPRNQNSPGQMAARKRFAISQRLKAEAFAKSQAAMLANLKNFNK